MSKSFTVTITEENYIRAGKMQLVPTHKQLINGKFVAFLIVLAGILGPIVFLRQGSMSMIPFGPPCLLAGILIFPSIVLPTRLKRLYSQQRELHQPLTVEIGEEGIRGSNQLASTTRAWADFVKWIENDEFILLYLSDLQSLIVPKSQVEEHDTIDTIRSHLRAAGIPQSRGQNIYAPLAFLLILWIGLLISIELGVFGYMR